MKKNLLTALLLMLAASAGAQTEKGTWSITPQVGTNLWTARYLYTGKELGLTAGAEVSYHMLPMLNVSLGADYTLRRFSSIDDDALHAMVANGQVTFPLQLGLNIWRGFSLRSGIQLGLNLHTGGGNVKNELPKVYGQQAMGKGKVSYQFNDVDWCVPIGLCYEHQQWVVDVRYYFSLKKNQWNRSSEWQSALGQQQQWGQHEGKLHDSMLQLTLGYRLPL